MRCFPLALLIALACALPLPAAAEAPALRVVVLPKVTANGQTRDAGPLEAWVNAAVSEAGHRVVSLDASLRAQAFALSDAINAGQVPDALTVLNADAAWSVQLDCDRDEGHRQAIGITYHCTLSRNVVRISSGDAVYSEAVSWHDIFGASMGQALFGGNVRSRAPGLLASDLDAWTEAWQDDGPWDADLRITGLRDRATAESLAERLAALPGVSGSRLVAFSRTVSHITLRGAGQDALSRLGEHIEADASLGLVVTHHTDRLVHAELDAGRMHRRGARVLVVPPADAAPKSLEALVAESGVGLVRSALGNLSWLEASEVRAAGPAGRQQLLRAARQAEEPYVVVVALQSTPSRATGPSWLVTASVVATGTGADVLTATGSDADPFTALDAAVRDLDQHFLAAAADPARRRLLGLPEGLDAAARQGVRVAALEVEPLFPARARHAQEEGVGSLHLVNDGRSPMTEASLELRAGGQLLTSLSVPDLAPGEAQEVPLRLASLPELDPTVTHTLQAQVTLSYRSGEAYGRLRAYAPLLVHQRNTLDWSEPESVAAFVDATDPVVRGLATAALAHHTDDGRTTRRLSQAATVHASLWGAPLRYVADPVNTAFDHSIDDVQHPRLTLERLAGDCDDLTVLLASLYESVGLSTVIITTPGHVLLGVDSGLLAGGHLLVDLPADRFVQVDGALFVPIETTAIEADFAEAWRLGAELVARAGTDVHTFRTRDAWRRFPTAGLADAPEARLQARAPAASVMAALPPLRLPGPPPAPDPIAAPVVAWLNGQQDEGAEAAAEACSEGVSEACFNLAVMLVAGTESAEGEAFPAPVIDALCLLPPPVVTMFLDHGGFGLADDASEASEQAEARRRLEEVLRRARERQAELEEEGLTDTPLQGDPMAGRRGFPVGEPVSVAPMFFLGPALRE